MYEGCAACGELLERLTTGGMFAIMKETANDAATHHQSKTKQSKWLQHEFNGKQA